MNQTNQTKTCPLCRRMYPAQVSFCGFDSTPLIIDDHADEAPGFQFFTKDHYTGVVLQNGYKIGDKIGQGGMGHVYKATDQDGNLFAIKILKPEYASDTEMLRRFQREIKVLQTISHPNVVQIYDSGIAPSGFVYMIMEYVTGYSLKELLAGKKQLPLKRVLQIAKKLSDGISAAHSKNIIHRDLKPDNIMIIPLDTTDTTDTIDPAQIETDSNHITEEVKILDFGIAKITEDRSTIQTNRNVVIGTPQYMSPEHAQGHIVDARSDLYSIGIIIYEMLAGAPPFQGYNQNILLAKAISEPAEFLRNKRPDLPALVERVVMRAISKNPKDRPTSVNELCQAFDSALAISQQLIQSPQNKRIQSSLALNKSDRMNPFGSTFLAQPKKLEEQNNKLEELEELEELETLDWDEEAALADNNAFSPPPPIEYKITAGTYSSTEESWLGTLAWIFVGIVVCGIIGYFSWKFYLTVK